MNTLFKYFNGFMIGMTLEYLIRVHFSIWPLLILITSSIAFLIDMVIEYAKWRVRRRVKNTYDSFKQAIPGMEDMMANIMKHASEQTTKINFNNPK